MKTKRCYVCRRPVGRGSCCGRRHCREVNAEIKHGRRLKVSPQNNWWLGCRYDLSDPRQRAMLGLPMLSADAQRLAIEAAAENIDFRPALSESDARAIYDAVTAIAEGLFNIAMR